MGPMGISPIHVTLWSIVYGLCPQANPRGGTPKGLTVSFERKDIHTQEVEWEMMQPTEPPGLKHASAAEPEGRKE